MPQLNNMERWQSWSIALVLKTRVLETGPRVRIPLSPQIETSSFVRAAALRTRRARAKWVRAKVIHSPRVQNSALWRIFCSRREESKLLCLREDSKSGTMPSGE
jgi:hypothetical protein